MQCSTCGKSFSSRNAHQNHLNSKKHKEKEKKLAAQQAKKQHMQQTQGNTASPEAQQAAATQTSAAKAKPSKNTQPLAEQKAKYEKLMAKVAKQLERDEAKAAANKNDSVKPSAEGTADEEQGQQPEEVQTQSDANPKGMMEAKEEEEKREGEKEEEEEEEEEEPILELVDSLFDTYRADSFEANVEYMGAKHGFFVPHVEYCDDLQGLIRYLQLKVGNYFMCIYCNKACAGLEAVRRHMDDKGHKQVDYSEEGQLELGDFYDFSATYPDNDQLSDADRDATLDIVPVRDPHGSLRLSSGLSLSLPSGASIGHRSMQRYHKQRLPKHDTRESVTIGRIAAQCVADMRRETRETERREGGGGGEEGGEGGEGGEGQTV